MDKLLIKCSNCDYKFFTKKVTLSKDNIKEEKLNFSIALKANVKHLGDLEKEYADLASIIKQSKDTIKSLQKGIDELDTIVQCSSCGLRLHALQNEVS